MENTWTYNRAKSYRFEVHGALEDKDKEILGWQKKVDVCPSCYFWSLNSVMRMGLPDTCGPARQKLAKVEKFSLNLLDAAI